MTEQLSALQVRIRASTLGARIHLQERTAVRMRQLGNAACLRGDDQVAAAYDRSAMFAERKAAALFEELLDLTEGYLNIAQDVLP